MQDESWPLKRVKKTLRETRAADHSFLDGQIIGSMCTAPHEVAAWAHALFLETNLGDPGHFPGTARLEQEVLHDLRDLLQAPARSGARFLTGGTEANLLAMAIAREKTGKKVVVLPDSAHFSFDKAALLLGMKLRRVPCAADGRADPDAMGKAIRADTALMVGVAGSTELGLVDSIPSLAKIAQAKDVLLHVDAAFGGYVIPFLADAGHIPKRFDFSVRGVWSIGLDPHKVGMSTIPGGALVLRNQKDWDHLGIDTPYVSTDKQTTLMGTRPGAAVAACWAVHRLLGFDGFASVVETCLDNTAYLAARLDERGYALVAPPELNVVTFRADDSEGLATRLEAVGLRVNIVPRFDAIRIVVNPHVTRHVVDRLLDALDAIAEDA